MVSHKSTKLHGQGSGQSSVLPSQVQQMFLPPSPSYLRQPPECNTLTANTAQSPVKLQVARNGGLRHLCGNLTVPWEKSFYSAHIPHLPPSIHLNLRLLQESSMLQRRLLWVTSPLRKTYSGLTSTSRRRATSQYKTHTGGG